jgi:hypothetical protein
MDYFDRDVTEEEQKRHMTKGSGSATGYASGI